MKYVNKVIIAILYLTTSLLPSVDTYAISSDTIAYIIKNCVRNEYTRLNKTTVPAYYISVRASNTTTTVIDSYLGACKVEDDNYCIISPQVCVGSPIWNSYLQSSSLMNTNHLDSKKVKLNYIDTEELRNVIIGSIRQSYENETQKYIPQKDTIGSDSFYQQGFSYAHSVKKQVIDINKWKKELNEISSIFKETAFLIDAHASITHTCKNNYLIDSQGIDINDNTQTFHLSIQANIQTNDGCSYPLELSYYGISEDELPSKEELQYSSREMLTKLCSLYKAKKIDTYDGPVLLSGYSFGGLMHELIGHRLEDVNSRVETSDTKKNINFSIMNQNISIYDDPSVQYYNNIPLSGYYQFDDEGKKGEKVLCVENGMLKLLLCSNNSTIQKSNGHGRAQIGYKPVARQGNLFINSQQPYSENDLRSMLLSELKKQNKEFGYYIKSIEGGQTEIIKGVNNVDSIFSLSAIEVYRIYIDGRADELVRGGIITGSTWKVLNSIEALGNITYVNNDGFCSAESGSIPVSFIAPMAFIKELHLQNKEVSRSLDNLASPQPIESSPINSSIEGDIILKAMNDEMSTITNNLLLRNSNYYSPSANIIIRRIKETYALSSHGTCIEYKNQTKKVQGNISLYLKNGLNIIDGALPLTSPISLPTEIDYYSIRSALRKRLLNIYNHIFLKSVNHLSQEPDARLKIKYYLNNSYYNTEEYKKTSESIYHPTKENIIKITNELTDYLDGLPFLGNSKVQITHTILDDYFVTSGGLKKNDIQGIFTLNIKTNIIFADSIRSTESLSYNFKTTNILSYKKELYKIASEFANIFISHYFAPKVDSDIEYTGPILLENGAVSGYILGGYPYYNLLSRSGRRWTTGQDLLDKKICIKQMSDFRYYKDKQILGYHKKDIYECNNQDLYLVNHGTVVNELGLSELDGHLITTGNEFISPSLTTETNVNVLQILSDKTAKYNSIRKLFLRIARKKGYKEAYIIKNFANKDFIYRVDTHNGKEQLLNCEYSLSSNSTNITAISKENHIEQGFTPSSSTIISPRAIIVEHTNIKIKGSKKKGNQVI